jgi:hypothetical protein
LVDQHGIPLLMIGDSPQAFSGNLSEEEAATFIAIRQRYGINTLLDQSLVQRFHQLPLGWLGSRHPPLTSQANLTTPNPDCIRRALEHAK